MPTNAEFIAKMEAQMKKWDTEVDELRSRGKTVAANARAFYFGRIRELNAKRATAESKFQQIRCASEEGGAQLQAGMEGAWETMRNALRKVTSELPK